MPEKTCILIATIGTRDLAYQVSSGHWWNVGNDRARYGDSLTQEAQVFEDLSTDPNVKGEPGKDFRSRTQYLSENFSQYQQRLQPIILGQLLHQLAPRLHKVYLIGTDQPETVQFRTKDTFYCAQIIKQWIAAKYNVASQVIPLGKDGENPADFDEMIRWCKQNVWELVGREFPKFKEIAVSPKGGVGQSSDALRVTALSLYKDQVTFYDFEEDEAANSQGQSSPYKGPYRGTHYLWDLDRREAIALLERYDYAGVQRLLEPYLNQQNSTGSKLKNLLELATLWNIADFDKFKRRLNAATARGYISGNISHINQWWWTAYEAAYLGEIRLEQGNTVEALFHSFRAVEGLMSEWAIATYSEQIKQSTDKTPEIKRSIIKVLPKYQSEFNKLEPGKALYLYGSTLDRLLQVARPEVHNHPDMQIYFDVTKKRRNQLFHRLLGLQKNEVFAAWGTQDKKSWLTRVLNCLNFISQQTFRFLSEASFMSRIHETIFDTITHYQP
ncbi:hypothetical protein [Gloeocapsopsis dulcis]|uniref:CRISPR-associated protein n=1 Tax=Gloeocapsopsis dulcis AAB1 = 1H9 TaxID=1433147 RepID=A0A6N8FYN6_9CHRO|nr:hypothetical protein [Gloeocapsopsis dulcis]MUL38193.1 hypothetical protein [Gloeocapsopsis dulcis AAB1 = 1H9]WNN90775.1 hypothetical protein P0S91_06780 [Gloeocapsopsis dulcis]